MILVRNVIPYSGNLKIILNFTDQHGYFFHLITLVFLLFNCHLSIGYHFGNDVFPKFPLTISLNYPTISHFPITQTSPYFNNHQFGLTNYFSNQHQSSTSSPFVQPVNPTVPNFWSPHQSFVNSDSATKLSSDSNSGGGGDSGDGGTGAGAEEIGNIKSNTIDEGKSVVNTNHKNHEKQAEKNTENMWQQDNRPSSDRRFGLLTKLWRKKKGNKQSTKHKHDHFHHQSVHHHHHHHHYHHHIHHYPGKKPNPIKSAMKKFKYKLKFKSAVKEIGEAPPTQHIYGKPTSIYPPPPPPPLPPPPYQHTSHHHYPGQTMESNSW